MNDASPHPIPQQPPPPPPATPSQRVLWAAARRDQTDYLFGYWSALGWTVLTLGIYSFYVFYQLVRRMRDHNARRAELFGAAVERAWEEAGRRGLQEELTPSFQRAAAHLSEMRRMESDFRDPIVWVLLSVVVHTIVELIAFVLLDQDLVRHDRAEVGVEYELALIYGRFGLTVPFPDQQRVKGPDNYVGRFVAAFFSLGLYLFWWYYDQMVVPNRHFQANKLQEEALVEAVLALG